MTDLLELALADLAEWPNSSAVEVAYRLNEAGSGHAWTARDVFRVLDKAAYLGACQRHQVGIGTAWLWQIPGQSYETRGHAAPDEEAAAREYLGTWMKAGQ